MKAYQIIATFILLIHVPLAAAQPNAHVTLALKPVPVLKAGTPQNLMLLFHPKKGIHINVDPAITITMEKNQVAESVGKITAPKDANGYLDASKPVLVSMTPSASAPKGKHTLKMKVVYFLCSDAEGWCNRDEQSLDVPVTVK
jgi:hypothetical protein